MINYPPNEGRVHGPANSSNIIIFARKCFCLKTVGLQFHVDKPIKCLYTYQFNALYHLDLLKMVQRVNNRHTKDILFSRTLIQYRASTKCCKYLN
jgi:hypothetical protein